MRQNPYKTELEMQIKAAAAERDRWAERVATLEVVLATAQAVRPAKKLGRPRKVTATETPIPPTP